MKKPERVKVKKKDNRLRKKDDKWKEEDNTINAKFFWIASLHLRIHMHSPPRKVMLAT